MPALPGEVKLSAKQAEIIMEKVCESGNISYPQIRGVSQVLSYLHCLVTGEAEGNWDEVTHMLNSYAPDDFVPQGASLVPQVIPSPQAVLVPAFTKAWKRASGWSLACFTTALLAAWAWAVSGCRSGVDFKSLKASDVHTFNFEDGWGCTAYDGGRNKLQGHKKGHRPWNMYSKISLNGARISILGSLNGAPGF